MEVVRINQKHEEEVMNICYGMYLEELTSFDHLTPCLREEFCAPLKEAVASQKGYVVIQQCKVLGYMVYEEFLGKEGILFCRVPIWAYGAAGKVKEKVISMLFQRMAEELCHHTPVHFEINLYAHDTVTLRLFSFLQFGIQCEQGIHRTMSLIPSESKAMITELSKEDIMMQWDTVWHMLSELIQHLRQSPVFYPGTEFTEEVYKDYFLDPDTHVFAAYEEESMVGIIQLNAEKTILCSKITDSCNVGEVYVDKEFRGKGTAQKLLGYVNDLAQKKGVPYIWVEHGTANPNARGFWDKYFKAYCYTMIRDINS